MAKHHLIISGTGRAGTTFLVQLLTILGLDTGFTDTFSAVYTNCNAGMEWDLRHSDAPYIIKSPWICDYLDELLENSDIVIDHVVVPIRDLYGAAESRRDVTLRTKQELYSGDIPGGLWQVEKPEHQEAVLTAKLYQLLYSVAKHNLPITLLYFPRLVHDPEYLYHKLNFMLRKISFKRFIKAYKQVVQLELLHNYEKKSKELLKEEAIPEETIED